MSDQRALVRNAADPQQVRRAARKEADAEAMLLAGLKELQATPTGRFVFRSLLERLGVFRSVWENSARIHYNAGRQDAGHELMALLVQADENAYELMEREARARSQKQARENDAVHAARAADGEQTNG